jgi:diguanylate cyclase (GGDEF)-like protein
MASFAHLSALLLALPKGWAEAAIVGASVAGSLGLTALSLGAFDEVGVSWEFPVAIATIVPLMVATPVSVVLMALLRKLEQARAEAHHLANTDLLTDTFNRRRWVELAERELRRAAITSAPVTLLVLDVDHFKQVNDAHGHSVGDAVLRAVAAACRDALRPRDTLARWGGEEFVILLPDTRIEQGAGAAERVRAAVAGRLVRDLGLQITVSLGVVAEPEAAVGYDLDRLVHLADRAMYDAKQAGRNRVHVAQVEKLPPAPARSA